MKDSPKKKNQDWDKVRITSTQTEVLGGLDALTEDLLKKAKNSEPCLIVIQGEMMGKVYRLKEGRTTIGRHPTNDISIHQRAVSSAHAQVVRDGDAVMLEDLKSTNGSLLNGVAIQQPTVLNSDDLVKIGTCVFKYSENSIDASFTESMHEKGSLDLLTGAYNKAATLNALTSSIEVAKGGFPLSLIIFDLDHFKKVNDTYGHIAGDYVLKETCQVIRESVVRSEDVLGRFGGEEFLLIMPESPIDAAVEVAERIRRSLEAHSFVFSQQKIPVTASLGVCQWKPAFKTAEEFVEAADTLLYDSKKSGRNKVTQG